MSLFYFTVVLLVGALPVWLMDLFHNQIDPMVWISCQLGFFLIYFGDIFSSAMLVIISVEKCFALYFRFKSKTVCIVGTTKKVSLVTAVIYVAFLSQVFYLVKQPSDSLGSFCVFIFPSPLYDKIFFNIFSILYTYAPFPIMASANFAIIYKFVRAKMQNGQNSTKSTERALSKSATRGTAMLLTVSFAFIILTGPISYATIFIKEESYLIHSIFLIFQYTNHGINRFLYCISGSRFRNELTNTLSCSRKNQSPS